MFIRNVFLQVVLITTCLLNNAQSVNRPNIIIVLADDLGWNDVSFHGSNQIPTPNIDALAYNGIILNSHYVPALCTPSRASLLTGKYPTSMGMQHLVILAPEPWGLPLEETLMPQHFKRHGYATHAIGKWHLGFHQKEYTPIYRGFDSHFGYWNGFQDYYDHTMQSESLKGYDMRRGLSVDESSKGRYSTDAFTDEAVSVIENHNSTQGPLFLYLSHLAPHAGNPDNPFQAPEEEIAKHSHISDPERRIYAAMVTKLDESIGKVVSALKNADMLDNSIILFMSDNGAVTFGMHSNRGSNYPLRGVGITYKLKESPWEGGVRGVAAVWSPLLNQTRRVSNQMMHVSDWLPTLYTAAGLNTSELNGIDGMDMWNTLSYNLDSPRTEVFNNYDEVENYSSLRIGSWKYVAGTAQGGEVDQWYGESGEDGHLDYDLTKVFESDTNVALSEYLEEKRLKSEEIVQKPISKDTIFDLRRQSVVTCSYPVFSELSLITNNHTEGVEVNITGEITNQRFRLAESKDKIISELEDYYGEHPGSVIRSNGFGFTPLERNHLENLIESGELVNVFKCDPLKMVCLFNLEKDPCERVNLAKIFPEIVREMEIRLNRLKESVVPPLNQPDDPFSDPSFHNGTWSNWCDVRRGKDSQILIKLLTESVSSALFLDHFLVILFENPYLKTVITPLFSIFHDASHHLVQLTEWFYWFVTLLICAVVVLYTVAAVRRLVSPQDDPKRKISWTRWENLTFRSITNPTAETEEDKSAFTKVR